jgi:DNA polymerase I-like protein with 3'-5' exonuclease and polymerase domains
MPLIAAHEVNLEDGNEAIYNALDTALTFEVDLARQRLGANDTLIYDFERAMQGPALEMMLRGFKVDMMERERAICTLQNTRADLKELLFAILDAVGGNFTDKIVGSDVQLRNLFYDRMRLAAIEQTRNGVTKRPMNRETLEKLMLRNKWAEVLVRLVLEIRDKNKALQVLETEIDNDFRWRCSYNVAATNTGRWSSSKSTLGTGNNFQNVTEELRRVFIPDPGFKLYGIDKAQSEARDVAWFCGTILGDWSYFEACESGDLHTYVTKLVYPEWPWTGDRRADRDIAERKFYRHLSYRDASKRIGHGTNYMGQPPELSKQTRVPLDLVTEYQRRYFAAFPCIALMHAWVAQTIQRERHLVNSFSRRRDFFGHPTSNDTLKGAVAYLFQSATGDCVNLGLYRLWKRMGTRIQILSQLHDAVYFQAPIPQSDDAEQELVKEALSCMEIEQRDPKSGRSMTIPGEVVGGFNWAHRFRRTEDGTLEDWNPLGLTEIKMRK